MNTSTFYLHQGLSVVLDFAANTRRQRAWMRALIDTAGVSHEPTRASMS
jgi:predicted kinase